MATDYATRPCIGLAPSEIIEIHQLREDESLSLEDALNKYLGEDLTEGQFRVLIPVADFYTLESMMAFCGMCGENLELNEERYFVDSVGTICEDCNQELIHAEEEAEAHRKQKLVEDGKRCYDCGDSIDPEGPKNPVQDGYLCETCADSSAGKT